MQEDYFLQKINIEDHIKTCKLGQPLKVSNIPQNDKFSYIDNMELLLKHVTGAKFLGGPKKFHQTNILDQHYLIDGPTYILLIN